MSKRFQRRTEDFTCAHCGTEVRGDGYTNHCPRCFWSRHVDVQPGDRASDCGGLMEPVAVEVRGDGYVVRQRCVACGHERPNRTAEGDDFGALLKLARRLSLR